MKSALNPVIFILVCVSIDSIVEARKYRKTAILPSPEEGENGIHPEPTPAQLQIRHNGHAPISTDMADTHLWLAYDDLKYNNLDIRQIKYRIDQATNRMQMVMNRYGALLALRDNHPELANLWNTYSKQSVRGMLENSNRILEKIREKKMLYQRDEELIGKIREIKEISKNVIELIKDDLTWRKRHYNV